MRHYSTYQSQFIEMFWGGKYTMKKLRGHIDVLRVVSYKPSDVHEDHSDNTSIVLRSNNIDGGQVNFDDLVYVDSERVSEHQVLNAGDIVMCGSNGSKKLVGKAALLNETPRENTSFGAFCLGIRCKSSIIPEYLATYFQTSLYRDKIEALGSGSNILNIKPDHIYDLEIPIPSLGEQETFVSIVKQADKSKFTRLKSQFIEMFGDPMANSKEWPEYGKINQYAQVILGTTPNSKETSYWDGDIKWITPAEMTDESYYIYDTERHITEEGVKSASLTLLPYRSVLFSTRAPIGKVGLTGSPMYCNQGFKNFICGEKLNPVYLYYSLIYKRDYLISLGTGTTFKELSKKAVEGLNITVPPLHFQDQFESIYDQADKSKYIN